MQQFISSLKQAVPDGLEEIQTLARTLTERASDILAYFDRPRTSNGPTEAINGRLEHLRGIALGFAQPHALHHPQPHPHRTPQRPPDNNHLNQLTSPTYNTLKHEEPNYSDTQRLDCWVFFGQCLFCVSGCLLQVQELAFGLVGSAIP